MRRQALGGVILIGLTAATCMAAQAAVHTVLIEGMQFTPPALEVNAGDTVVWKNKDPFPHTATADNHAFDSGSIPAGGSWKFVARKRGSYPYTCTLHQTMKAQLVVK
jgi:plastocyanin